jgi:glyoxylase-like metal-dependent hydrolase (beta-lactamase superfamily II)
VSILAHGASGVELLVGDTLTAMFRPDTAMLVENASDYRRTLARIRALSVETFLPGHGRPFPPGALFRGGEAKKGRP